MPRVTVWAAALIAAVVAPPAAQAQALSPIFDAHVHYNLDIGRPVPVEQVFDLWRQAGIRGVLLTSRPNDGTREIHDAVKRRCLYHWVDYPTAVRELEILARKVPGAPQRLSQEVVAFVQKLRSMDLFKLPGVAETIDWSNALVALDRVALDPDLVDDTLGALLKYQDDIARVRGSEAARLLEEVRSDLAQQ